MKLAQEHFQFIQWMRTQGVYCTTGVLTVLILAKKRRVGMAFLKEKLGVSAPTITQTVAKLESLGIVKSLRGEVDRRTVWVSLAEDFEFPENSQCCPF